MKIKGPIVTLAAVAVVGIGLLLVNISQQNESTPPSRPAATTSSTAAPPPSAPPAPPPPPSTPAPDPFPPTADYVGKVPTKSGTITLEITVSGSKAVAYACDGNTVEVWLSGSAEGGVVALANKDKTSQLNGRHVGKTVVGTLQIGEKSWEFTTSAVAPPAGLYVSSDAGARNSWIVDADGSVTGVQRRADGSTAPAPGFSPDTADRVDGATNVS